NPIKVDVRVIAATNRDLAKSIREGKFREDLFYRLNVFPIALPPLRDREGDVPLLAHFLVARFAARIGVRIESVGKATMERLSGYPWPGNIRSCPIRLAGGTAAFYASSSCAATFPFAWDRRDARWTT